ncbi:MAG: hypothetical protein M1617_04340 [Actinobacteria bacterium]|nr:hypothetical protein [Actinomycetota bacterium]
MGLFPLGTMGDSKGAGGDSILGQPAYMTQSTIYGACLHVTGETRLHVIRADPGNLLPMRDGGVTVGTWGSRRAICVVDIDGTGIDRAIHHGLMTLQTTPVVDGGQIPRPIRTNRQDVGQVAKSEVHSSYNPT